MPFYNYLQAAFVLHEDGRLGADGVLRVAVELVTEHRFDGDALARSYLDLARRGHLRGTRVDDVGEDARGVARPGHGPRRPTSSAPWRRGCRRSPRVRAPAGDRARQPLPDYVALASTHNARRRR